ncbi:MAG: branched-chain amino acid ABC transporter permease [Deltaproteobacteria bacterium]|nr:branched-chain amino acid ABC transporter permease [Deltaproteobacteria bacterium]
MALEILIYGAVLSGIYALLAVGFALIFGVARVVNLTHGAFYMLGAYTTYALSVYTGLPMILCILLGMAVVFVLALLLDRLVIEPIRSSMINVLITTLALSLFADQAILQIFGPVNRNIPALLEGRITILGVDIAGQRLLSLIISCVVIAALWWIITRTKMGNALMATSQDPEAAQLMGIDTRRMFMITMGVAAMMAALAGSIVGSFLTVQPQMGMLPLIKAFTIVILGGLGSLGGSIVAALLLGYLETMVAYLVSSNATELVPLVVIFLTLVLRPSGLFGKRFEV